MCTEPAPRLRPSAVSAHNGPTCQPPLPLFLWKPRQDRSERPAELAFPIGVRSALFPTAPDSRRVHSSARLWPQIRALKPFARRGVRHRTNWRQRAFRIASSELNDNTIAAKPPDHHMDGGRFTHVGRDPAVLLAPTESLGEPPTPPVGHTPGRTVGGTSTPLRHRLRQGPEQEAKRRRVWHNAGEHRWSQLSAIAASSAI